MQLIFQLKEYIQELIDVEDVREIIERDFKLENLEI
jgi:hypothetical protein